MKTNREAKELIYKKAKEVLKIRKRQQRRVILNSLSLFVLLPVIMLSFSTRLFNSAAPVKPAEASKAQQSYESPSSSETQRKIIYVEDAEYFNDFNIKTPIGSRFLLHKEEFFNQYKGQNVEFLVSIGFGELNVELKEALNNTPLKSAELYPDITWNEFEKIRDNFVYHYYNDEYTGEYTYDSLGNKITYGDFTYDLVGNRIYEDENVIAEIDRMFKYENSLKAEIQKMKEELINKNLQKLNLKIDYDLMETYKDRIYGIFAYITLDDIKKLKDLPFGMRIVAVPENNEDMFNMILSH